MARKTKTKTKKTKPESKYTLFSFRLSAGDIARLDRVQARYGVATRSDALRIAIKNGSKRGAS